MIVHLTGGAIGAMTFRAPFDVNGMPQAYVDVQLGEVSVPVIDEDLEALVAADVVHEVRTERYTLDLDNAHFGEDGSEHHVYRYAGAVDPDTDQVQP
jgi:hypothetical protein